MLRRLATHRLRMPIAGFTVAAGVILAPYIESRTRSSARQVRLRATASSESWAPADNSIRILSFNIAHGRGTTTSNWVGNAAEKRHRIEEISDHIESTDADIVVLNEVDFSSTWSGHQNQAEAIATRAGFTYWVEQRNVDARFVYGSWKFGNAILSRFPILDATTIELPSFKPHERLFAGHKQCVVCTLQLSRKRRVRVVAVHLEHRDEGVRVASAKKLLRIIGESRIPIIVAGDFNSTPTWLPGSQLADDGANAMDKILKSDRIALPSAELLRDAMTFPATNPERKIDWILVPAGCHYSEYRTISCELSDHLPVLAEFRLPLDSVTSP